MENYIGEICHFPYNFTPRGFHPCKGDLLPISAYQVLYSLIGTKFGGNATTNFKVPDLRGKSPLDENENDCHYFICISGIYPVRD